MADAIELSAVDFGRPVCGDLAEAERREWLVTNGIGGYASGTIAGTLTRRYHGLLVASLKPPVERTLLFTKIDERVRYAGSDFDLGANRWQNDYVAPQGWLAIERFYLDGALPVWHYAIADGLLEKRVWMEHGANTTYVRYRALRAECAITLTLRCFVNYRSFHANTHAGDWRLAVDAVHGGARVTRVRRRAPVLDRRERRHRCDRKRVVSRLRALAGNGARARRSRRQSFGRALYRNAGAGRRRHADRRRPRSQRRVRRRCAGAASRSRRTHPRARGNPPIRQRRRRRRRGSCAACSRPTRSSYAAPSPPIPKRVR